MSRFVTTVFLLVIALAGLAIHLRNDQAVLFDYYLGTVELPFSVYLVLALCAGAVLGAMACLPVMLGLKQQNLRLRRRVRLTQKELNNLRSLPASGRY